MTISCSDETLPKTVYPSADSELCISLNEISEYSRTNINKHTVDGDKLTLQINPVLTTERGCEAKGITVPHKVSDRNNINQKHAATAGQEQTHSKNVHKPSDSSCESLNKKIKMTVVESER